MKLKIGLILTLVLVVLGLLRYCDRPKIMPTQPGKLAPDERERIEIKGRTVTVIRADKTVSTFAPNGTRVSVRKDGTIDVSVRKFGLTHEPGLSVIWNGEKLKLAVDMKFLYYRRVALHLGTAYDPTTRKFGEIVRPIAFASYALPFD